MLEQLYSPLELYSSSYLDPLREITADCITRHVVHHYLGFSARKWKEFEQQEQKQAKTLLYVYRVLLTGLHVMQTHEVQPNLNILTDKYKLSYVHELIAAKVGDGEKAILSAPDVAFYQTEYSRLATELEAMRDRTTLPDEPARKDDLNELLIEIRRDLGE